MTIFEQAFKNYLIQSNLVQQRVFLWKAPQVPAAQQKHPYFVFFQIGPSTHPVHGQPLKVVDRDYQISIFDPSQSKCIAVADSLRQYLDGKIEPNFEGVRIGMIQFRLQSSALEDETQLFHIYQQYRIQFHMQAAA